MKHWPAVVAVLLGGYAILATLLQLSPATFFIELLTSDSDKTFPIAPVLGLTFLSGLIPFAVVVGALGRMKATPSTRNVPPDASGIWLTRPMHLPGMALNAPVFVDQKRVAELAVGRSIFIGLAPGEHRVCLSDKSSAAESVVDVPAGGQPRLSVTFANSTFAFAKDAGALAAE